MADEVLSTSADSAGVARLFTGVPVLCDGAMGTMLYARGVFINRCYDELNLSQPEMVREVHAEYLQAGAEVVETNTFGANCVPAGALWISRQGSRDQRRRSEAGAGVRGTDSGEAGERRFCGRVRLGRWVCGWSRWARWGWMRRGRRLRSRLARWSRVGPGSGWIC